MDQRTFLAATAMAIAATQFAVADSPKATAVLSNSEAMVGQMVEMQVKVSGVRGVEAPREISVEGLEIHNTGQSQQVEMNNFTITASVVYTYTILPLKAGTFRIPPQSFRAGGSSLQTEELTLHVVSAAAGGRNPTAQNPNARGGANNASIDTSKVAFVELVVPKKTAYVGEVIPVVVRVGFFGRGQPVDLPEIKTQGFTMQKFQAPDHSQTEEVNGRRCEVVTYKTALAATRPGKFDLGPVEVNAIVVVPRQRQQRSSNRPFDPFDMDDPFSDPFFADPWGMMGRQERRTLVSEPVALEVKPLPANAPANFSGAVGNFTMTVDANPKSVQTGDPITVISTITGRGNFDRVDAPSLEDDRGWHKYPPSSKFKQDDDVGISGAKTFEVVLSPNEKKQNISPFSFSFFDPTKEKYVTLRSDAIPIRVEGAALASTSPATAAAAASPSSPGRTAPTPPTAATPKPQDILYLLTDRPSRAQSFTPLYQQRVFWFAQVIPLLGIIGFVGWNLRKARLGNREARRIAALHNEVSELMKKLRRDEASRDYFAHASRAVQVKTALVKNVDPNVVDAETAASAFELDDSSRTQLRKLFEQSDEARYSGAANGGISAEKRREMLHLIDQLHA